MAEEQGPPEKPTAKKPKTPAKPRLRVVSSTLVPPPGERSKGMTRALWESAETYWLNGSRSITGLARHLKVSPKTSLRLVHKGYPKHGWPPLKDRAQLYDAQQADVQNAKQREQLKLEADEMARAKRDNLLMSKNVRIVGAGLLARVQAMLAAFPAQPEAMTPAQAALRAKQLQPVAAVYRHVSLSLREAGVSELTWIRGSAPETERADEDRRMEELLATLSADQWDYISRTGLAPAGVDPAVMKALMGRALVTGQG